MAYHFAGVVYISSFAARTDSLEMFAELYHLYQCDRKGLIPILVVRVELHPTKIQFSAFG